VEPSVDHHLKILLRSSSTSLLFQKASLLAPARPQDQECWARARYRSSPWPPANPSSSFCNQVFFEYDPSSATSLLSSAGISARVVCYSVINETVCVCFSVQWCECVCGDIGPWIGALRWSPNPSCDLLLPGVLWLRSFFGYQSSFFDRHLGQAPPPPDCDCVHGCASNSRSPEWPGMTRELRL